MTTACVQNLPCVPLRNTHEVPKFYKKTKKLPNVHETKEDFCGAVKKFHNKYPTLTSLYTNEETKRKLTDQSNLWSYGTPFLVKLLFTGNLPKSFFDDICKASENSKKRSQTMQSSEPRVKSGRELWHPKDHSRLRESGRRVEQKIFEARMRHLEHMENVSLRAEKRRIRTEEVLLRKAGELEKGKKAYIEKLEKKWKRPGRLIKRECQSRPTIKTPDDPVFQLTETKLFH